jgi:hypothetical protein
MVRPKINKSNEFVLQRTPNQDELKTTTEHYLSQSTIGASTVKTMNFRGALPDESISIQYTKEMLEDAFKSIGGGNLAIVEEMLLSQAFALNVAFNSLAVRAARQQDTSTMQMLMNLCFKAQNQSRATLDTLIQLKRPSPTTFVKQANIASGHQQINNLVEKNSLPQNELLEDNYAQMDNGTTATPKGIDKTLEALGKVHGSKNTRGKSKVM